MSNPQTQAIGLINELLGWAVQLKAMSDAMVALDGVWSDNNVGATLNAFGTVALNADGSPGAADGTVNTAHPINPTNYPGITRMLSATQITQIKTILDTIPTLVSGSAVSAQSGARGILNFAAGT